MNDPTEVSPDHYKTIFENDKTRVIQVEWQPGDRDEMHSHPHNFIIYALTDIKLDVQTPDGVSNIMDVEAGSVTYMDPVEMHSAQNVGKAEARAVLIDFK